MFANLPDELNEQIVNDIGTDDKATLKAICVTNKLGHRLAIPSLYSKISVLSGEFDSEQDHDIIRLQRVCQTLVQDPSLCFHVRSIRLGLQLHSRRILTRDYLQFDKNKCVRSLEGVPRMVQNLLIKALESDTPDPSPRETLSTLLLVLCRKATTVQLEGGVELNDMPLLRMTLDFMRKSGPELCFSDVTLIYCPLRTAAVSELVPVMRFPCIQSLVLQKFLLGPAAVAPHLTASVQSTLLHLQVRACTFNALDFAPVLTCTPHLRSLCVQWYQRTDNFWRMDWPVMGNALRKLADLEVLRFEHQHDHWMTVARREQNGLIPQTMQDVEILPMGSLKKVTKLREMVVPAMSLFGSAGFSPGYTLHGDLNDGQRPVLEHLLPSSLRKLTVLHEDIYLAGSLRLLQRDPMVTGLDEFMVYNCQKDRWICKDGAEDCTPIDPPELPTVAPQSYMGDSAQLVESLQNDVGLLPPAMRPAVLDRWYREAGQDLPYERCMAFRAALRQVRAYFRL